MELESDRNRDTHRLACRRTYTVTQREMDKHRERGVRKRQREMER